MITIFQASSALYEAVHSLTSQIEAGKAPSEIDLTKAHQALGMADSVKKLRVTIYKE